MNKTILRTSRITIATIALLVFFNTFVPAQRKMDRIERQQMQTMLSTLKGAIEDKYYDPGYHGIKLDARFEAARQRIDEVDTSAQAWLVIGQVFLDFNDSHLFYRSPLTNIDVEYGYRAKMMGDKCIVTTVMPKSDAAKQGLKEGDQLLSIHGFRPNRRDHWKINYVFGGLNKQGILNLIVLRPGEEKPKTLAIKAKVKKRSVVITEDNFHMLFDSSGEVGLDFILSTRFGSIAYLKLPSFGISPSDISSLKGKFDDADSLVLDLRGNGGGRVDSLERLSGHMFDEDFVIATPKGREEFDPMKSESRGGDVFKGKLVVLIDHDSASASEIFARTVQLKKRGFVIGDVSAGAVMMSRNYQYTLGNDSIFYGASITVADVIMPDGKSIEHIGVIPDQSVIPSPSDVAKNLDPALSAAVRYLGGDLSANAAGAMFDYEWDRYDRVHLKTAKKKK